MPRLPSFRAQTAVVIGLVAISIVATLCALFAQLLALQVQRDKGDALATLARGVARALERGMAERGRQVQVLAQSRELWAEGLGSRAVRQALDRTRASRPHAAWVGVADLQGIVRGASDGLLIGQDVSGRPWFAAGLTGPHVGDVHPAKLLAGLLPPGADGEPARFVDFAAPIVVDGRTLGVLAMHGNWEWARDVVRAVAPDDADARGIEVFVMDARGRPIHAPTAADAALPLSAALREALAAATPPTAGDLDWGGGVHLTAITPVQGDTLGWRVVVRQPAGLAYADVAHAVTRVIGVGALVTLLAAAVAWVGSGLLSRPLVAIARAAREVERGTPGATIARRRDSAELAALSGALARMTERLLAARQALERRVEERTRELVQANAQLVALSAEQHAMLDNELVGIARLRGHTCIWKNRALEQMFGYAPGELLECSARVLHADDDSWRAVHRGAAAAFAAGQRFRTQVPLRRRNGDRLWADLSGTLLSAERGESLWLVSDVTAMKEHQRQVEHIAFHDALTGLPNRLLLADRLPQAIALAERLGRRLALCYLDLDGFKAVNDRAGHDAGDALLREIARRLQDCVRSSDTVARLGGDEFVVVLSPLATPEECEPVLARIVRRVAEPLRLPDGSSARVTVSIGVACCAGRAPAPAQLMARADAAMYEAKRGGRNQVRWAGLPAPVLDSEVARAG